MQVHIIEIVQCLDFKLRMSPMKRRKGATTQIYLDHFFKRVDRVEYSRELEPGPSMSGVSEIAAYPPSPAADCPSLSSPPLPPPVRNSVHLMLDSVYQR